MRSEENTLDLNNFPEDYTQDDKLNSEDSCSSAVAGGGGCSSRKKKSGGGKDEAGKVYECRFCSLKFCKSQALGGHMNRHRQERETEELNKARQLVMTSDLGPGHNIGYVSSGQLFPNGSYQQSNTPADPSLFRSIYPTRMFPTSSPFIPPLRPGPPPSATTPPPYMYTSPQRIISFPSQYQAPSTVNDYFVGHVISPVEENYTCIGEPLGHGYLNGSGREGPGGEDRPLQNQEKVIWGRR